MRGGTLLILGHKGQRSKSTLALCGTIATTVFAQSLSNFTCKLWWWVEKTYWFWVTGYRSRSTLPPCEGMPRFALSSLHSEHCRLVYKKTDKLYRKAISNDKILLIYNFFNAHIYKRLCISIQRCTFPTRVRHSICQIIKMASQNMCSKVHFIVISWKYSLLTCKFETSGCSSIWPVKIKCDENTKE